MVVFALRLPVHAGSADVVAELDYQSQKISVNGKSYTVRVPKGYQLEFLADIPGGPRLFTFTRTGELLTGSKSGNIYRLRPPYRKAEVLLRLDNYPHSVAVRNNTLYIAQTHGLFSIPYTPGMNRLDPSKVTLVAPLSASGGHSSRTVAVGPDKRIYVSIGISGNCSDEYIGKPYDFVDWRGGVMVLDESGNRPAWRPFATGLRNPVGFDWHPVTGIMYASNNGPDHHGFEQPPEYFSRLTAGSFHGMPWFQYNGTEIQEDDCIDSKPPQPITNVVKPAATFPARNAPMGVAFIPAGIFGKAFTNNAVVALRGSWGTKPTGGYFGRKSTRRHPKLVVVRFSKGRAIRVEDLVTGFQLPNGSRWARPVGVGVGPDGYLYFTSDTGLNGLFRLRRVK